jgi:hypothetical protein
MNPDALGGRGLWRARKISSIYSRRSVCCNGRSMPLIRLWLVTTCLVLATGCPGDVPPRGDLDGPLEDEIDAPIVIAPDARIFDARPVFDARVFDAMPSPDSQSCTVNGVMGICIDMTVCKNMGKTATAGHCPNTPVNIQCCTP